MNFEVIVTCAVTGAGETVDKSPHVPVTPKEVAVLLSKLRKQVLLQPMFMCEIQKLVKDPEM